MLNKILSLIFPSKCVNCGKIVKSGFLCYDCKSEYEKEISDGCLSCGNPHDRCSCDSAYLEHEKMLHVIPYRSEGPSREMLLTLKSTRHKEIIDHLTDKMVSAIKTNRLEYDMITYVPRSPTKIRIEGVDQAKILAFALSEKTKIEAQTLFICRGGMKEQKELEYSGRDVFARERFSLIMGAEERVNGKRIFLVDDIITSGATAKVCSELLYEAGALDVTCLSAGRSVKY